MLQQHTLQFIISIQELFFFFFFFYKKTKQKNNSVP